MKMPRNLERDGPDGYICLGISNIFPLSVYKSARVDGDQESHFTSCEMPESSESNRVGWVIGAFETDRGGPARGEGVTRFILSTGRFHFERRVDRKHAKVGEEYSSDQDGVYINVYLY